MAQVELLLSPLPSHVRTARLVGVAAARRAGLDADLVDELRLAVGEACSRAVGLHVRHACDLPVRIVLNDDPTGLTVTVTDAGPPADGPAPELDVDAFDEEEQDGTVDPAVALAVLAGLVDDFEVGPGADGANGTTVRLRWPLPTRLP